MTNYWKNYWNSISLSKNLQSQVGRTINKAPISDDIFKKTLGFLQEKMEITDSSILLDLCCGNGVVTLPFAKIAKHITAIDFSKPLIEVLNNNIKSQGIKNVTALCGDINTITPLPEQWYSHILIYFALQHFSEQRTIFLFEKAFQWLQPSGIFYLGDIPDRMRLWNFANTNEYVNMYFDSVKNDTPAIGTWFLREDLVKLSRYTGFSSCEIIEQPDYQINSAYRFDLKLRK